MEENNSIQNEQWSGIDWLNSFKASAPGPNITLLTCCSPKNHLTVESTPMPLNLMGRVIVEADKDLFHTAIKCDQTINKTWDLQEISKAKRTFSWAANNHIAQQANFRKEATPSLHWQQGDTLVLLP